jgi:hypothetical protein
MTESGDSLFQFVIPELASEGRTHKIDYNRNSGQPVFRQVSETGTTPSSNPESGCKNADNYTIRPTFDDGGGDDNEHVEL